MSKRCYSTFRSTVRMWKEYIASGQKSMTYLVWRFGENPTYEQQKNIRKLIAEKGYITTSYDLTLNL